MNREYYVDHKTGKLRYSSNFDYFQNTSDKKQDLPFQDNAQVKGSFNPTMQDGQYVISLFKGADASTVIHETDHYFCITFNVNFFDHAAVFKILVLVYNTRKLRILVLRRLK